MLTLTLLATALFGGMVLYSFGLSGLVMTRFHTTGLPQPNFRTLTCGLTNAHRKAADETFCADLFVAIKEW